MCPDANDAMAEARVAPLFSRLEEEVYASLRPCQTAVRSTQVSVPAKAILEFVEDRIKPLQIV